jgi:large subunit ribosomal protein L29
MAAKLELHNLSEGDLNNELLNSQREYIAMKLDHATQGLANPNEIKVARRNVARIQTEIRKRELSTLTEEQLANRSKIRARRK